ncbi:MAG: carboxylesterase family protein [Terricaulis sp.]
MAHADSGAAVAASAPLAQTKFGPIQGVSTDGVLRFWNLPYAAPPVGARRFALPQSPQPWTAPRDGTRKGFAAPQSEARDEDLEKVLPGVDLKPLIGGGLAFGDDYLVLNVWTPALTGAAPVMVFIHGGAFTGGVGASDAYDGTAFAKQGVVLVTINYRLGVEGFVPIEGAPTNLGLRDQLFALKWVQENIAGFGGDANNVTVFGESAGAMSISNLVASPLAKGLFKRAIIESGHGNMVRPISVAQRLTKKLAKIMKITPDLAGFRATSNAACLEAQKKISLPTAGIDLRDDNKREPAFGLSRFLPVYGDDVLPEHPHVALAKGASKEIDILIGTNRDEMNLYFVHAGKKIGRFLAKLAVKKAEPLGVEVLKAYGINDKSKRPHLVFTDALNDLVFRLQARRFAQLHQGRTHFYEFKWKSPVYDSGLGACHALELPFVFNTLSTVRGPKGLAGPNPPQEIADRMNKIWADFAKTGALPWPEYTTDTQIVCTPETGEIARDADMPAARIVP